jgi:hypothetical protein
MNIFGLIRDICDIQYETRMQALDRQLRPWNFLVHSIELEEQYLQRRRRRLLFLTLLLLNLLTLTAIIIIKLW